MEKVTWFCDDCIGGPCELESNWNGYEDDKPTECPFRNGTECEWTLPTPPPEE